jgi:two-component system OmpR family response regulator
MRIFVVGGESRDLAAIENALRLGEVEILTAAAPTSTAPDQRRYAFAGWTLDAATRDLANPIGRRVNLTSSEYELLMTFVRQPGQSLSRGALLGALRGRAWSYFDRSIDTLVARLRKKIDFEPGRPPLIRPVRGIGYVFCASVSYLQDPGQSAAA